MTYENSQFNSILNNELFRGKKIVSRPRMSSYKQLSTELSVLGLQLMVISPLAHIEPSLLV